VSAVRNVIMDLGGVLLEWNPDELLKPFQPDPELRRQLRSSVFSHDWRQFDRGQLTEAELHARLTIATGHSHETVGAIIDAARGCLREKPETVKLVRTLRQRGFNLFCLSNMPGPFYQDLRRRHDFWDVFHGVVISGEIQMMKPEAQIYRHLLERFDLLAHESVFVDDLQPNVDAAKAVGLHAICFRNATQCEQELEALLAD
jgi:putative hydrolase of the HAD superfamily